MNRFLTKFAITRTFGEHISPAAPAVRLWTYLDTEGVFFGMNAPLSMVDSGQEATAQWTHDDYVLVVGMVGAPNKQAVHWAAVFRVSGIYNRVPGLANQALVRFAPMPDHVYDNPMTAGTATRDDWAMWYAAPLLAVYRSRPVQALNGVKGKELNFAAKNDQVFAYPEFSSGVKSGENDAPRQVSPRDIAVRIRSDVPVGVDADVRKVISKALRTAGYRVSSLVEDDESDIAASNDLYVSFEAPQKQDNP